MKLENVKMKKFMKKKKEKIYNKRKMIQSYTRLYSSLTNNKIP